MGEPSPGAWSPERGHGKPYEAAQEPKNPGLAPELPPITSEYLTTPSVAPLLTSDYLTAPSLDADTGSVPWREGPSHMGAVTREREGESRESAAYAAGVRGDIVLSDTG